MYLFIGTDNIFLTDFHAVTTVFPITDENKNIINSLEPDGLLLCNPIFEVEEKSGEVVLMFAINRASVIYKLMSELAGGVQTWDVELL